MPRVPKATLAASQFEPDDVPIFLATVWAKSFSLAQIIAAYDGVNHAILNYEELVGALNRFLSAGLIRETDGVFTVPDAVLEGFDSLSQRRKREHIKTAESYLIACDQTLDIKGTVTISETEFDTAVSAYLSRGSS